jgi:hypothetical protein
MHLAMFASSFLAIIHPLILIRSPSQSFTVVFPLPDPEGRYKYSTHLIQLRGFPGPAPAWPAGCGAVVMVDSHSPFSMATCKIFWGYSRNPQPQRKGAVISLSYFKQRR